MRIPGLSRPVKLKQVVGLADIVPTVCRLLDLESGSGRTPDEGRLELDDQTKRRLEAIGYVRGEADQQSTFDQSKEDAKDLIDYYNASMRVGYLISQRKFALARAICLKLAENRPDIATAHLNLAEISASQGAYQDAVRHAKKAIEIRPDDAEAHYQLGLALQSLEKTADAIEHYRAALAIQPGKARAHFNLGLALNTQQKLDQAIEHYRKAIQYQTNYTQAHNNLAIALYSVGKRDEAIEHVRQALAIDPSNATARENLKRLAP